MADFMKILQQAQEMQGKFATLQAELEKESVTATSGGGMVTVEANGKGTVTSIKIDASVVNPADVEMLEDLVLAAVGDGLRRAQEMQSESLGGVTGGLDLGSLGDLGGLLG